VSDEQIAEYLRSRARVRPPMDLAASVADAVADVPQQRRSWFASVVPAGAALAATAVVIAAAVLVGPGRGVGPGPGGSPSGDSPAASTSPITTPTPSTPALIRADDRAIVRAADAGGTWGVVTLTRGQDVGGYDDGSVGADAFVVEVHVQYEPERAPDPEMFGAADWRITAGPSRIPIGDVLEPDGRVERDRPSLGTYPGAIDIFTNPLEGWLLFVVPREAAVESLELVYQPTGFDEPVASFLLRTPAPAPEPVAAATPGPTPAPVTYVERDEYPFPVIDHPEADELFGTPDTCTNPEAGYTVTYPDAWFTNTEIGDWAACTWFSPTFFDVGEDPNEIPPQVAIVIEAIDGEVGFNCEPDTTISEPVTIGGLAARRWELVGCTEEDGTYIPHRTEYQYVLVTGQPAQPRTLTATATFEGAADYELNKAVLDRIMALIEFDE
jgi:hypothetical protein